MKNPPPNDFANLVSPAEFAIDKGRLYGIAEVLDASGFDLCARDVRRAADCIETMRVKNAH
jgi:hypothetical protein